MAATLVLVVALMTWAIWLSRPRRPRGKGDVDSGSCSFADGPSSDGGSHHGCSDGGSDGGSCGGDGGGGGD